MRVTRPGSAWFSHGPIDAPGQACSGIMLNSRLLTTILSREMKKILSLLLLFILLSCNLSAWAGDDDDSVNLKDIEKMSKQLKDISKKLRRGEFTENDLSSWTKLTIKMKGAASLCVSDTQSHLEELKKILEGLGEKVKDEDPEVTRKRIAYIKQQQDLDKRLAKCNLFVVNSSEVANHVSKAEKSYFREKYLVKTPTIIELTREYLKNPTGIIINSGSFIFKSSGISQIGKVDLSVSIVTIVISILLAVWMRRRLFAMESRRQWQDDYTENLLRAILTTTAAYLPYITGAGAAAIAAYVVTTEAGKTLFITQFFTALTVYFASVLLIRMIFSPVPPAKQFISFTPTIAQSLARRLKVLAVLALIGYLAFYTVFAESIVENNLLLMRNVFSLVFVLNLVWTLQVIISSPKLPRLRYIAMLVIVILVLSVIAEWSGYRNLAFETRRGVLYMFIVFMLFIGVSNLFRDLFNAIDEGTYAWCRRIHQTLGVDKGETVPGLIWLRFLMSVVIWGGFAVLFINAIDYSGGILAQVTSYLINGFTIGNFHIVPSRILLALLVFGLVLIFSSWLRSQMESNWLRMTGMAPGARDALVTILGYVMFVIALMAGLSVAGFDFSNIAIIAGALSVGIGFGLQNIVNNFVSGLILLFERPIRKGDWIMVGETEGVVKEIQIRSTRIQTFDRSDVIVPNSELISNQVTNWVLSSPSGRAIIPVGVAYGSDTEQVREILLQVAEENENVMKSGSFPKPRVLFREFGDSSLNFELRVFLHNVDNRLSVISDLNFAIDKAFREAGIEIPFPQRDLHIKSMPDNIPFKGDNEEQP